MKPSCKTSITGISIPAEGVPPDSPYGRLVSDLAETEEKLLPCSPARKSQLYAALVQHNLDIQSLSCEESFIDGFRLGARLILEFFQRRTVAAYPCINRLFLL